MCLAPLIMAHVSYNSNRALVLLCEHADPTHDHRAITSRNRCADKRMRSTSGSAHWHGWRRLLRVTAPGYPRPTSSLSVS